jgi:hypothetical protein
VGRLRRFPENRFVGRRDQMRVFDCDSEDELALLSKDLKVLESQNFLQAFAPDSLLEASNRGFWSANLSHM